jgi:hypothetical protein
MQTRCVPQITTEAAFRACSNTARTTCEACDQRCTNNGVPDAPGLTCTTAINTSY